MRSREFITLLGGAAAWPLAARAQQLDRPIVGVLAPQSQAASARNIEAFRKGLRDLGYVEGRNITLEIRYGDGVLRPQSSTQATPHIHLHPKQWTTKPTGATEVLYGAVWLA